jgi:hypothetical protein
MTTKKGLAVISSGGDAKHLLYDTPDASAAMAELGADDVVSTIHTTVDVKDMASDLASTLNAASASVETRIEASIDERDDIRGEMDNVASRLGAQENASDTDRYTYVADGTAGSTIGGALSFAGADQLLANKLVTTAQSIATLENDEDTTGSVDEAIKKYLRGAGSATVLMTVQELGASMGNDTTLSASIMTELGSLKTRIREGVDTSLDNLEKIEQAIVAHETNTVAPAKALINERLKEVAQLCDAAAANGNSFSYSVNVNDSHTTGDKSAPAAVAQGDMLSADEALDKEHAEIRRRYNVFVGTEADASNSNYKGIETQNLTVAGATTVTNDTSFVANSNMSVPVYTATGSVPAAGTSDSQVVYLNVASGFAASAAFPANKKFYFCEDGEWFASPFHSE